KLLARTPVGVPVTLDPGPEPISYRVGIPAYDAFPFEQWARLQARLWRNPLQALFTYENPAGYDRLRQEIATYLQSARAVRCQPEQIIVVSGSQQALMLTGMVLLDAGDAVWMEDPGYTGARAALLGAGANLIPVPVDEEGINVEA